MTTDEDDRAPASATESLRLIATQRADAARGLTPDPRQMYWPWGVAWLIGFALFFLRYGPDGRIYVDMPAWVPFAGLYGLMLVALVVTTMAQARVARHMPGTSSTKGTIYGFAWFVGFLGMGFTLGSISDRLPQPELGLVWAASSIGLVAMLYVAGAAVWSDRNLLVLGAWLTLINIAGVLAGPGWHSLVISLAGGVGLLVGGAVAWRRLHRTS